MIWESWPWKQELLSHANNIENSVSAYSIKMTEEEYGSNEFKLERSIFYSAFIVRKLIENAKLTDHCSNYKIKTQVFLAKETEPTIRNYLGIEMGKDFKIQPSNEIEISIDKLMSELIHSFLLEWETDADGFLNAMFVSSYKNKKKRSLRIGFSDYCKAIRILANDEVTSNHYYLDPDTGKVTAKLM